jgi:hypothetical protein
MVLRAALQVLLGTESVGIAVAVTQFLRTSEVLFSPQTISSL